MDYVSQAPEAPDKAGGAERRGQGERAVRAVRYRREQPPSDREGLAPPPARLSPPSAHD